MELIFMGIEFPDDMDPAEAVRRARELVPCETGAWEPTDVGPGSACGNLECEDGFYDANPDGGQYGPDDRDVTVSWETP